MIKIISGGQTGADQGGLVAGALLGLATGGWAPNGWRTDIGPAPWLANYGVQEHRAPGYPQRTAANVRDSDGTVIIGNRWSPGCTLTQDLCRRAGKPLLCIDWPNSPEGSAEQLRAFCAPLGVLNVAGNRERSRPGIYLATARIIWDALRGGAYPPILCVGA